MKSLAHAIILVAACFALASVLQSCGGGGEEDDLRRGIEPVPREQSLAASAPTT